MHELWNDVRIAARRLRHSPGFVLVAVLSLTMAIAASLVVFGVMNAAILRPLNVAGADRLQMVEQKPHGYISQSYPDYEDCGRGTRRSAIWRRTGSARRG